MEDFEDWDNIQGRRYTSVGRCIYCGSDGGAKGLSDEHMVPFSLGGDAVLPKASCEACATETSKIELYLARHIFHGLRSHIGAPSRKKSLPSILSATISVGDQEGSYEFVAADQPFALMLPTWDYPGIMRQVQPTSDFQVCNVRAYNFMPGNLRQLLGLADDAPDPLVHIGSGTLNNIVFARAIAKIAYCNVVARYGLGGFRPLVLPDLILGRYPCVPYFVGSDPGVPSPPNTKNVRHAIQITTANGEEGLRFLLASVRPFAHSGTREHGMPIYHVVSGAPRAPGRATSQ
jgi:HNH endonuclease